MHRLKKWHRLGIVISIIFIIYSMATGRKAEIKSANELMQIQYNFCTSSNPVKYCLDQQNANYERLFAPDWINLFLFAALQILIAWILVLIIIYSYKWIMKGR